MNNDLISRQAALSLPRNKVRSLRTYEVIEETVNVTDIENLPPAQPEWKFGRWVDDGTELGFCCSECGSTFDDYFYGDLSDVSMCKVLKFCPNCGAKMEE